MCGRYASSRKPEDLAEEFEIDEASVKETVAEPLQPDFNVAPTKEVYAVVERPGGGGGRAVRTRPPGASSARCGGGWCPSGRRTRRSATA